ncbi:MAG: Fe-S cluster assembly protein NifU [Desulfovibrionaceae bacterium]|nr:Fe-S cluster assembly protein NifU [Desulfovibrionaceae bacterium]
MHFSTRSRYGLRFLLRLAERFPETLTLREVASEEGISVGYLEQIVGILRPLKLFRSIRGSGGGYTLIQNPATIPLDTILLKLEGTRTLVPCLDTPCERSAQCAARLFWEDFDAYLNRYLRATNLKSLLARSTRKAPMWDYTQAVHDHFLNPHHAGPIADANAIGEVGSLACGDALRLYLKISKDGIIEDAGFETFGCASAIASSSVLTDMVIGMHVDAASAITNKDIVEKLGGLPREKMHCSVMGQEALEAALRNWRGEKAVPHAQEIGKLVCKCFGITDAQIVRAIRENGLTSVEAVTDYTKAGGACGECRDTIAEILASELNVAQKKKSAPKLTNVQRMRAVMKLLDSDISPTLPHGASVELIEVDGNSVSLSFTGTVPQTLRADIEALLRKKVEPTLCVLEV